MNPFRAVLSQLGWQTSPSHEDHYWVYLLLQYGASQYDDFGETSTYADPFVEVLSRMKAYPGPAYTKLAELFNSRIK
jgi:hypothetical protein